jgi:uncharacterized membrane protein
MEIRVSFATGLGIGAALMYWLDPERGPRRRALVRDRAIHAARVSRDAIGATGRDVMHRTYGTAASVAGALSQPIPNDDVLVARVRAKLGRVVSHPHAVDVTAADGVVTLRGPILRAEVPQLLETARAVHGVRDVVNELEEHNQAGDVPALQGGARPSGLRADVWQEHWSPATRLLVGGTGVGLMAYCGNRRDTPALLLGTLGFALFARALINVDMGRLTGFSSSRRAVDVQKTITIDAPVEAVFEFWRAYENFPRFMSRVLDVRQGALEDQSHWTVAGPAGMPVTFDAELTRVIPNQVIAWRTVEGSTVAHAGIVEFEPTPDEKTRLNIRMTYNPPGGWFGHGVAAAFGVDPKSSMDADLARMKTLIETGRAPRDAAQPAHV